MERNEQPHEEAEETLDQINKKTGRNMPQAIATGAALVILIVACCCSASTSSCCW